jgi:DnaJ-class molecular chaperone
MEAKISSEQEKATCPHCQGSGTRRVSLWTHAIYKVCSCQADVCPDCDGEGRQYATHGSSRGEVCWRCNGDGRCELELAVEEMAS